MSFLIYIYFFKTKLTQTRSTAKIRSKWTQRNYRCNICFIFYSITFTHVFWQSLNIFQKGTRPFSADLTKVSHSDLLKEREENYRKAIEREKIDKENYQKEIERERIEKEKLQRENEEMKNKLAELSTAPTSIQVN